MRGISGSDVDRTHSSSMDLGTACSRTLKASGASSTDTVFFLLMLSANNCATLRDMWNHLVPPPPESFGIGVLRSTTYSGCKLPPASCGSAMFTDSTSSLAAGLSFMYWIIDLGVSPVFWKVYASLLV